MDNYTKIILVFLIILLATPLSYKLIRYIRDFNIGTKHINNKLEKAESKDKIKYWKRRKTIHYLRLIPFVNRKNAPKLYRFLKGKSKSDKSDKDKVTVK